MAKTIDQSSFSGKSKKPPADRPRPPVKKNNKDKRSREHLSISEVNRVLKAAKAFGRRGERDSLGSGSHSFATLRDVRIVRVAGIIPAVCPIKF